MLNVLLADDHRLVLDGFSMLLDSQKDITVLASFTSSTRLLQSKDLSNADLIILDYDMPEINGIEAGKSILKQHPSSNIMLLTMLHDQQVLKEIVKGGFSCILKNCSHDEFLIASRRVASGNKYYCVELVELVANTNKINNPNFTPREMDVLKLIGEGLSSRQISDKLFIAPTTVETHRRNLLEKTGSKSSKTLIRYALKQGIVS